MFKASYLPREETTKIETEKLYSQWSCGCYKFLLQRTTDYYDHTKVSLRRQSIATKINKALPPIGDDLLTALYIHSLNLFSQRCFRNYQDTGFRLTPSENKFLKSVETVIQRNPTLSHLEIYPSQRHSKSLPRGVKMAVGVYIPDFLIFGLKHKGFSSVAIEIDGDSHVDKFRKDMQKYENLQGLDIFTISIPNDKVTDVAFIEQLLKEMCPRMTTVLEAQINLNKRKIQCKTVSCHMTLAEIEAFVGNHFRTRLHLVDEANEMINMPDCPRVIKKELTSI